MALIRGRSSTRVAKAGDHARSTKRSETPS
jgi:hypothetical protein